MAKKIVPLKMDLSDIKSFSKLSDKLKAEEKKSALQVRWLINNAGSGRFGLSKDFSVQEISDSVTSHCAAVASLCNICIPYMKAGDHIVNVASQSAFSPLPYINLYAATKAFVYSYTRALREELRESGIVVTAVCPGWIQTALLPETLNGRKVKFPLIVTADKVAAKAIKDARRGKAVSIYRFAVRVVAWLQRHLPNSLAVKIWAGLVKQYV
ncbi:MAG: SDR family NAD(P)-dependent oxidoreductase [Treponema sp.]|nr:SDR family NAD(P)-dependent oxidoreductase [Treponema sp.]